MHSVRKAQQTKSHPKDGPNSHTPLQPNTRTHPLKLLRRNQEKVLPSAFIHITHHRKNQPPIPPSHSHFPPFTPSFFLLTNPIPNRTPPSSPTHPSIQKRNSQVPKSKQLCNPYHCTWLRTRVEKGGMDQLHRRAAHMRLWLIDAYRGIESKVPRFSNVAFYKPKSNTHGLKSASFSSIKARAANRSIRYRVSTPPRESGRPSCWSIPLW